MDELKGLVEAKDTGLINLTDKDDIVKKLQEIGTELLTNYEIRVNNITIEPLRVEPYFFNPNRFEDKFMHSKKENDKIIYGKKQRNRFGKLYIHSGFSGVDIVLSAGDNYALSYLIKNSRVFINDKCEYPFLKQYGVADVLDKNGISIDYDEEVLCKKNKSNEKDVFRTVRNGLINDIQERPDFSKEEQNKFNKLMISSFIELNEHTLSKSPSAEQYDFENGYGKIIAVAQFMFENDIKPTDDEIRKILGFTSEKVRKYIRNLKNGEEI